MRQLARLLRLVLLTAVVPAMAQEGEVSPADSPTGWVFRWINFVIVLGLIVFAFRKAAPVFRSRADQISQRIAEGAREREAAERQRGEVQAKLAGIESEVSRMRAEARRSAEAEAERLKELTRAEAETIERAADGEIAAAERAARLELKAWAARMAVERAEAALRQKLTPQNEARLFGAFVSQLGRNSN